MTHNSFWREETAWPYVHTVIPLAVYFTSRDVFFSLWLIYLWESVEFALAMLVSTSFYETAGDSLVGDPLLGTLSIASFALLDTALGWDTAIVENTSLVFRFFSLLFIFAASFVAFAAAYDEQRPIRYNAIGIWALYTAAVVIFYAGVLFGSESAAQQSVLSWLVIVTVHTVVIVPNTRTRSALGSAFFRMLFSNVAVLIGAFVTFLIFFE